MKKKDLEHQIEVIKESRNYWMGEAASSRLANRVLTERNMELAKWLMSEWVFVHESKTEEVDRLLADYIGGDDGV